jgi:hypothetical protein
MPDQRDYCSEIAASSEDRRREFKSSAPWNQLKFKITRAALAMANTRGGGLIILGVQDDGQGCSPSGLTAEHLSCYDDDEVRSLINQYADPYVICSIHRPMIDEKQFIVIDVSEFDELPVICKKAANDENNKVILQAGGVYIRSYQKPESCLVQSQTEMREMMDIAIERGIRRFLARAEQTGVSLRVQPTHSEQFDQERREFDEQIAGCERFAKGHYLVSIRPTIYNSHAIEPISLILDLANRFQVRYFGWKFPFIVRNEEAVEQRCAGIPRRPKGWEEFWRMYQSGQFLCAIAYREDAADREPLEYLDVWARRRVAASNVSGVINIHTLIRIVKQAYEFAAGLATPLAWDSTVEVTVTLTNTADRVIVSTDPARPARVFWQATAPQIKSRRIVEAKDLLAKAGSLAAAAATEILERFAKTEIHSLDVAAIQQGLFDGR